MIIDVHAHALTREFLGELARENAFGIESRDDGFGFGGYGPLGNKFVEGEGIELRRNVRQASLFHARIIEARPRQSRATGR